MRTVGTREGGNGSRRAAETVNVLGDTGAYENCSSSTTRSLESTSECTGMYLPLRHPFCSFCVPTPLSQWPSQSSPTCSVSPMSPLGTGAHWGALSPQPRVLELTGPLAGTGRACLSQLLRTKQWSS